jgi:hypothetical protein
MERLGLIKGKIITNYGFYLRRLCSKNGIKPPNNKFGEPSMIPTIAKLEDRLFGVVYKDLGWNPTHCPYYHNWSAVTPSKKADKATHYLKERVYCLLLV